MSKYGRILLSILMLTLSGCGLTGTQRGELYPQRYTLSAPASPVSSPSPELPVVLGIASVSAPNWLNSAGMIYRLEYDTTGRLATYSRSRWAGPPAAMLQRVLENTLADSGHFKAVTDDGDSAASVVLRVSLTDFEQVFTSRQHSVGVLNARATLLQSGTESVLAQHAFHYQIPASSADAGGGVQALDKASSRFSVALDQWLQDTLRKCRPACFTPAA